MDVVSVAGSTENGFGFYVEEVKFFMMDMGVDWTFLVKRAAALPDDGSFCQVLSTEIPEISDRKFAKDMEELTRQAMPIEAAKGPKIVFFGKIPLSIPAISNQSMTPLRKYLRIFVIVSPLAAVFNWQRFEEASRF